MNRFVLGVVGLVVGIAVGAGAAEPAKKPQVGHFLVTCPDHIPLPPVTDAGNGWKMNVGAQYFARVEFDARSNEVLCWYSNQNGGDAPATDFLSRKLPAGAKGCGVAQDGKSVECTGTDAAPATASTAAATGYCSARSCGACVGEGGCWWSASKKACTSEHDDCKDCVNELAACPK